MRDRWVRFHALPESKRYPETEADYSEILRRHNLLLEELSRGTRCYLVTTGCSFSSAPERGDQLSELDRGGVHWKSIPMHELSDEWGGSTYWHLFVSRGEWRVGIFDSLLRLVADGDIVSVFVTGAEGDSPWVSIPMTAAQMLFSRAPLREAG